MSFNTDQDSYKEFRETLKQRTSQIVLWSGAGLSTSAELPSWAKLKGDLVSACHRKAETFDESGKKRAHGLATTAENEPDYWQAFEYLKQGLQETSYRSSMRTAFAKAAQVEPPAIYKHFWEIGITAFITLNIDRFSYRAFSSANPGKYIREFDGLTLNHHIDVFKSGLPFVLNLHGNIDNDSSWIFTTSDLKSLQDSNAYRLFIESTFTAKTVLFVGITADDPSISRHLERIKSYGVKLSGHYWLTHRNDTATHRWAEANGIQLITYTPSDRSHPEIPEMLSDLRKYIPKENEVAPLKPDLPPVFGSYTDIAAKDLEKANAEDIRRFLNRKALHILRDENPNKEKEYSALWSDYDEAIYRAWSISTKEGKNDFFDFKVKNLSKRGGFAEIYEGHDKNGKHVAVKVLHGNVRTDKSMMEGFRRGVEAMKILSEEKVDGIVPYIARWEIPTCAVMDFIEGPNLEEAAASGQLDWEDKMKCAIEITRIIGNAHALPHRVLHRDIRPANIMLQDYWTNKEDWRIMVLDFDLSWHRDAAGYSVPLASSNSGYLAPEQIGLLPAGLTRNALVDSYGLGMTFLLLFGNKTPSVAQHRHAEWPSILKKTISDQRCDAWRSLPRRLSRLVEWATKDRQAERWDIARIHGELSILRSALSVTSHISNSELLAEEILSRAPQLHSTYTWDIDKASGFVELRSGFTASVRGDMDKSCVRLSIEWTNTGDRSFKNVGKYIGSASDRCTSALKKGGWFIDTASVTNGTTRIAANIFTSRLRERNSIDVVSNALVSGLNELRLE